jgi:serine/threonine protein kinase
MFLVQVLSLTMLSEGDRQGLPALTNDNCIGEGGFGSAHLVRVEGGKWASLFPEHFGKEIVVKRYSPLGPFSRQSRSVCTTSLLIEFTIASFVAHENVVVPLAASIMGADRPIAFFPYYNLGSLYDVLQAPSKRDGSFIASLLEESSSACKIAVDIVRGIAHIHSLGILHNDLHQRNILVHLGGTRGIKAGNHDFGLASRVADRKAHRVIDSGRERERHLRLYKQVAPELVLGAYFSRESDMFAVGIWLQKILRLTDKKFREKYDNFSAVKATAVTKNMMLTLTEIHRRPTASELLNVLEDFVRTFH